MSIPEPQSNANVRPRLAFGDIDTERRYSSLARNTDMERQLSLAMQSVERLLTVCHRAGVAPWLITDERAFYLSQTERQAAFYGDEDGQS